ncbi:MAG: hypothetical protein OEQ53_12230 [Saprospiraceae bacterium]|nr:hypothetical protein [Saprospiraceae bacterium]
MNLSKNKASALAIIIGSVMIVVTMALHPTGGSLEYVASIAQVGIYVHTLAIASIPLLLLGFLGLTSFLKDAHILSPAAFVIYAFGMVAVMIAAAINGLATPDFILENLEDSDATTQEQMKLILSYQLSLNHALDKIFIMSTCVSSIMWSLAILKSQSLPIWIGITGVVLGLAGTGLFVAGFIGLDVQEFGLFIFGYAGWSILVGIFLWRTDTEKN